MKKTISFCALALFALAVLATSAAMADDKIFSITVSGEGKVCAVPDKAEIFIRVEDLDQKQEVAVEEQAKKMQFIMDFLRGENIPSEDISTLNYSCGPRYEYDKSRQKRILVGYAASQYLKIRVSKDAIGEIIHVASTLAFVENITFVVGNREELLEQTINLAIEDAKLKAQKRASALGIKLGAVLGYQENVGHQPYRAAGNRISSASAQEGDYAPEIPVGEAEIRAAVSITYEIVISKGN